jgi:hypothetical protein
VVRSLTIAAAPLGVFKLSFCISILAAGWFNWRLSTGEFRTLTFLMLVLRRSGERLCAARVW